MQAVDKWGNVAVSTNKGLLFAGAPPAPPTGGGVDPSLTGQVIAGWFSPSAGLQVEADDGVAVSVSIDGGPLAPLLHSPLDPHDGRATHDRRPRLERLRDDPVRAGRQHRAERHTRPAWCVRAAEWTCPAGVPVPRRFVQHRNLHGDHQLADHACDSVGERHGMTRPHRSTRTYTVRLRATDRVGTGRSGAPPTPCALARSSVRTPTRARGTSISCRPTQAPRRRRRG